MILYHGSYIAIEKPDLSFSRALVDFGPGFYVTPHKSQAAGWAARVGARSGHAVVSSYSFLHRPINERLPNHARVLEFDTHSPEWLEFVVACRTGHGDGAAWDLVIGGVANDRVYDTVQLYFDGLLPASQAIERLRYNKPSFQYCFKSQWLIDDCLHYIGSEDA